VPALANFTNLQFFVLTMNLGGFAGPGPANSPAARRAAELVNRCVSDHLPVILETQL
jgi:hypothetical protein